VIKGQMSLVGPRPFLCEEFARFEPWQKKRLKGNPGMTSAWHISGRYVLPASFQEWIRSDIEYIENMNFFLDMQILLRTIYMIFCHVKNLSLLGLRR